MTMEENKKDVLMALKEIQEKLNTLMTRNNEKSERLNALMTCTHNNEKSERRIERLEDQIKHDRNMYKQTR